MGKLASRSVAAMVACLLTAACSHETPEDALRARMSSLQAAIEARDPGDVRALLAEDFIGPGGMDREQAVRLAQLSFLRHRAIGVTIASPVRVAMQPRHASVAFDAALTGGSGRLLPDAARLYSVQTGWRLEDDGWRLTSATWTPGP